MFGYYLDLPNEVRMMIIDETEPDDRCRMTRCSKLCNREAKASKKYIHLLEIIAFTEEKIIVTFLYNSPKNSPRHGYKLEFVKENGKKYMRCKNANNQECWVDELNKYTNLVRFAIDYFKKNLKLYQNIIKHLHITRNGDVFMFKDNDDLGIERLKNVEELYLDDSVDARRIVSKIRKPLKNLSITGLRNRHFVPDIEQIYVAQDRLTIYNANLNFEKFMRLSASKISMHIGILNEEDVFNFIRMWQNGTLRHNFEWCFWVMDTKNFSVNRLVSLLGVQKRNYDIFYERDDYYDIQHLTEAGKLAELIYHSKTYLRFIVNRRNSSTA